MRALTRLVGVAARAGRRTRAEELARTVVDMTSRSTDDSSSAWLLTELVTAVAGSGDTHRAGELARAAAARAYDLMCD
ncbi:hypothetical protein [Streptomyces chiangmaiensis]|uniref:Uncharacterized protein n=1 Tax=Streptomyces chiangmaiensis TaxID=766497 RepID=A0ABU7FQR7_9ACTN|nr:hypothetical protein [Streptomyces chiangmaiensis]MED7826437.1 hypothetical protein [Streptomyces chiangmaiensis]